MDVEIREGTEKDYPAILSLIQELAAFARSPEKVINSVECMNDEKEYHKKAKEIGVASGRYGLSITIKNPFTLQSFEKVKSENITLTSKSTITTLDDAKDSASLFLNNTFTVDYDAISYLALGNATTHYLPISGEETITLTQDVKEIASSLFCIHLKKQAKATLFYHITGKPTSFFESLRIVAEEGSKLNIVIIQHANGGNLLLDRQAVLNKNAEVNWVEVHLGSPILTPRFHL